MKLSRPASTIVRVAAFLSVLVVTATAFAQEAPPPEDPPLTAWLMHTAAGLADTVAFGLLGIGLSILGFKLFDKSVPWSLGKEIEEDHNVAAAIVVAAMFLGTAAIIAAVIVAP